LRYLALHWLITSQCSTLHQKWVRVFCRRGGAFRKTDVGLPARLLNANETRASCAVSAWISPPRCCLYEMLMGKRPFDSGSKDRQKLRLAIAQGQYERVPTERCGGQLRRLVEKCLSYMPEDRPSVSEILEVGPMRQMQHSNPTGLTPRSPTLRHKP